MENGAIIEVNNGTAVDNTSQADVPKASYTDYGYVSVDLIGVFLNILVVAMVALRPIIRSKISRILLIHQCATDAIGALLNALRSMIEIIHVPENVVGELICRVWATDYLQWSVIQTSVNSVMLFTVERYLSIVRPVAHRRLDVHTINGLLVFCWIMGFVFNICMTFDLERDGSYCQFVDVSRYVLPFESHLYLLLYVAPIAVLIPLYSHMILVLRKQKQQRRSARQNTNYDEVSRDLTIMVAVAVTAYTILFAPQAFIYYIFSLGAIELEYEGWLMNFYDFLVNLNFIVNPFVFVVCLRSFRRELRRLFVRTPQIVAATEQTGTTGTTGTTCTTGATSFPAPSSAQADQSRF